jgi:hypothetical protein
VSQASAQRTKQEREGILFEPISLPVKSDKSC